MSRRMVFGPYSSPVLPVQPSFLQSNNKVNESLATLKFLKYDLKFKVDIEKTVSEFNQLIYSIAGTKHFSISIK